MCDDTVHAVWYDTRHRNNEIYYLRSEDGGVTWWPAYRLTNDPSWSTYPSVAVSGPLAHVVWEEGRDRNKEIYYKRSSGRWIWSPDTRLTLDSSCSCGPSVAAFDSSVHVVWWDCRDGNIEVYYKRSTDGGTTWGADVRLSHAPNQSGFATIAVAGPGVHVAWWDDRQGSPGDIYYTRSSDGGATWQPETLLTYEYGSPQIPSLTASDSAVYLVWNDYRDGNPEIYFKRSSNWGESWGPDTRLTYDPAGSSFPSVAVSGSLIHVVWQDTRTGGPAELFYKRSLNGGNSWSSDFQLTNALWTSQYPTVAVALSRVHVLWSDQRDGNWEIYYKRNPTGNSGVEESSGSFQPLTSNLYLSVVPNPFVSFTILPGHSSERFSLYDISGRLVGVYKGERIGEGLPPGVYFLRPPGQDSKPFRVVKVR